MSDSSSDDSSSSEDENFTDTKTILAQAELPPDFWQVRPGKEVAVGFLSSSPGFESRLGLSLALPSLFAS